MVLQECVARRFASSDARGGEQNCVRVEDFGEAAKALREADARRDSIFAQSVDAQKNKEDVMAKKFAEAVKKAKETPLTDRPLRDFDLD